jgi:8-hydroxy-5-deazaflavin:NADPH oxidoreductase
LNNHLLPNHNTISILGGTGKEGKGLAYRWAKAGYRIVIGSRSIEKAEAAVDELMSLLNNSASVVGATTLDAVSQGDFIVLTVPYPVHREMLETIKSVMIEKILIDVTVPLVPPRISQVQMPPAGSAAMEAKQILGEGIEVVSAFQNISYENLLSDEIVECDVLVCGGSKDARGKVLGLVNAAGLIGWDAGPIENSVVVEGMTSILLGINKKYGIKAAGIRITGKQSIS